MGNPEAPGQKDSSEQSRPENVEIYEKTKQEIIVQGLSARTKEDLEEFYAAARIFLEGEDVPPFFKLQMLKAVEQGSKNKGVRDIVREFENRFNETMADMSAQDRRESMELYAKFAIDAENPEKVNEMIEELEKHLDAQKQPMKPPKQSFEEIEEVADDAVREAEVKEMKQKADGEGGSKIAEEAEEFLKRQAEEWNE